MDNLLELQLKPETLQRHGLPDIAYPIPAAELTSVLDSDGELSFAVMLHGLQQRAGVGGGAEHGAPAHEDGVVENEHR